MRRFDLRCFIYCLGLLAIVATPRVAEAQSTTSCGCGSQIDSGLIAYWPLDELSGAMFSDLSGNSHDAIVGSTTFLGASGAVCSAAGFGGLSSDVAKVPSHPDFRPHGEFAVLGWIRIDQFPEFDKVLPDGTRQQLYKIVGQFTGNEFAVTIDPPEVVPGATRPQLRFFYEYGNDVDATALVPLTEDFLGEWRFFVGQYDASSGSQQVWLDGVLRTSVAQPAPAITSTGHLGIGGESFYSPRVVEGLVDEVRLYGRALTAAEIAELYACGARPRSIQIDVKPGSDGNAINLRSRGVIPVAVLSSETFDATELDSATITFGPGAAVPAHRSAPHFEDVNGDGLLDAMLHFRTQATGLECSSLTVDLHASLQDGTQVVGSDRIRTVGCR